MKAVRLVCLALLVLTDAVSACIHHEIGRSGRPCLYKNRVIRRSTGQVWCCADRHLYPLLQRSEADPGCSCVSRATWMDERLQGRAAKEAGQLEEEEDDLNYKPPAPKALVEIVNQDQGDENLVNHKQALLVQGSKHIVQDAKNRMNVIIQKFSLLVEGRGEVSIDLTQPEDDIKEKTFSVKEGCKYQIKIYFLIQREIVAGLRYHHIVMRKGIRVDSMTHMMGSYGPKTEVQSFTTPVEEAPSGWLKRGAYKIKSKVLDDDRHVHLSWEWHLEVKRDW